MALHHTTFLFCPFLAYEVQKGPILRVAFQHLTLPGLCWHQCHLAQPTCPSTECRRSFSVVEFLTAADLADPTV